MFRTLLLSISFLGFFSAFAESHHDREKIKIEINEHDHHHKQKGIGRMFFDGTVQLVENNAYLLSAAGAGFASYLAMQKGRINEFQVTCLAAGIWLGGGMITRSVMKAVMSQADIKRI